MLNPRWQKVLRDLQHNKTRTILVVLSIAVGVMSIRMLSGSQGILARDMQLAYQETNPDHAVVFTEMFDNSLVDAIRRMPSIADAEGRREVGVRLRTGPDEWQALELIVISDFENVGINKIWPLSGTWPPPKREMLLERASLAHLDASIGGWFILGGQLGLHFCKEKRCLYFLI
ncbi:hypothetical protein KFU94_30955 [Chloroflexi bacterium TSY]|nr:hypothetical protein [Chloroflexi bacterium TSY]